LIHAGAYLGHEFSGVLAKVGSNVESWKIGDRVTVNSLYMCGECYACLHGRHSQCAHGFEHAVGIGVGRENAGGFAKFVRVPLPQKRLFRLPDEVSFEEGALLDPLSGGLHAVRSSDFEVGKHVVVLGAGPIGLSVVTFLKYAGAGLVIVAEVSERRSQLAKKLGADYVLNPHKIPNLKDKIFELTNGEGVEIVFDCSGVAQAFQGAPDFLRRGGQVLLYGIIENYVPILPMDWAINEWQLKGGLGYYADDFPLVIEFLKKGTAPVKEMITKKIKLSNIIEEGFDVLAKPGHNEIKILVEPDE
jgi:(R,R)-butanediol dehydrogenase/meso-butanediol dehydrogenase/diacetyl reductase